MSVLSQVRERLRAAFHRGREEAEMDAELRFHLEMQTEQNLRSGMDPAEARRQARLAFGPAEHFRDQIREARGLGWLESVARDLVYAWRGLRLNPTFTLGLVGTLGFGVGACAAMFSIVDALLLRPLPYHRPDRLVELMVIPSGEPRSPLHSYEEARAWMESGVFASSMGHYRTSLLFTGSGEPRMLPVSAVTLGMDAVLGVRPVLGRTMRPEDTEPGSEGVAILDHAFWRSEFGGDPGVLGRTIELGGHRHRVIGVMPEGFKFPIYSTTAAWLPIPSDGAFMGEHLSDGLYLVGRMGPGPIKITEARAAAAGRIISQRLPERGSWRPEIETMQGSRARGTNLKDSVWKLTGAVGLLLLVSAVNAVGLLLVRGWSRAKELAVRVAIGASRGRIVAQLLAEGVCVAVLSAIAAVLFAAGALRALRGLIPESITFFSAYPISIDWRAIGFTVSTAVLLALITSLIPALRVTRMGGPGAPQTPFAIRSPGSSRLRGGLVVSQVALSVLLLTGSGLLLRSYAKMLGTDPGFDIERLAILRLSLSSTTYPSASATRQFLRQLEERLEALPGVSGVALNGGVPPAGGMSFGMRLEAEGAAPPTNQPMMTPFAEVPPDFFEVLGVRIVRGRAFTQADAGTDHAIIDAGLARFLWGERNPIGRRFRLGDRESWSTVVGVTPDLKMTGPDDRLGRFEILRPMEPGSAPSYIPIAIRTEGNLAALLPSIRRAVRELDPRQPIESLASARTLYADAVDMHRFLLVLVSVLAGLGLLLASIGIYGVLSYTVVQQRREIAIRTALGSPGRSTAIRVIREGVLLSAGGALAGICIAMAAARVVESLLYETPSRDPATLAIVMLVSLVSATLASAIPAIRALGVQPAEILRGD